MASKIEELKAKLEKIKASFGIAKQELTEDPELRRKHTLWQKQKLIDSLKAGCRTDGIKSAGNGL